MSLRGDRWAGRIDREQRAGIIMTNTLDRSIQILRSEPPAPGYDHIDQAVWRGISDIRRARKAAPVLNAVRAAAVVGGLALGVAGGGVTAVAVASQPQEISAFSVDSKLAPSTLLDGQR